MKITNSRHLALLIAIMDHDGALTSEELAVFAMSSARTIKSDIAELNETMMQEGIAQITATRSKGYYLQIINAEKYAEFKQAVMREYGFFRYEKMEAVARKIMIAQRLLYNEYTLVDDLAEALYLTKTAIKSDLAWVTAFFASYEVEIVVVPGKGLTPKGKEEDIRSLMVEVFCSQYHEFSYECEIKEFHHLFYDDPQYYADLRHEFLRILRESKMSILDIDTKKLATYLCLMQNRLRSGHTLTVSEELSVEMRELYEYQIAEATFASGYIHDWNEAEKIHFTKLLVCYRDIDLNNKADLSTIQTRYIMETENYLEQLIMRMRHELGGKLFSLELFDVYKPNFLSLLMPVYLRSKYDSNKKQRIATYFELGDIERSPIAMQMTRMILMYSSEILHEPIAANVFAALPMLIDDLFKRVNYQYTKRRLAVVSLGGKMLARLRAEDLKRRFGSFIESADAFNQYEMRRINFSDYDSMLGESKSVYNYYPIHFAVYTGCGVEDESLKLFHDVFIHGFSKTVVNHMIKLTAVYPKFTCDTYTNFLRLLSYKHAKEGKGEAMFKQLMEQGTHYSFYNKSSQIAVIFCPYQYTKKEFIEIYQPASKLIWVKPHEIKYLLAVNLRGDLNVSDLKMVNKILFCLSSQPKYMKQVFENVDETIEACFVSVVTNRFLSQWG